jgi:hypothetical protein
MLIFSFFGEVTKAREPNYLYWVELRGFQLHRSGDPSGSGEVSIMMALGPGKMVQMVETSSEYLSAYANRVYSVSGRRFYIPRCWIKQGYIDLYFFLRDRDDPFADDIIVPPRSVRITLNDALFLEQNGNVSALLDEATYRTEDGYQRTQTRLELLVLRKKPSKCLFQGDPDVFFSRENDKILFLQELRALGTAQLIGGVEWRQFTVSADAQAAKKDLEIIQEANARVLMRYRNWLLDFKGHFGFEELVSQYKATVDTFKKRTLEQGEGKKPAVPMLSASACEKLLAL